MRAKNSIGDPTETAIIAASYKNGITKDELSEKYPRLGELPFDSDRKLMSTVNMIDGKNIVIVKGAFDVMAERCISGDLEKARQITNEMSEKALRVLAIGYKEIDAVPDVLTSDEIERGLIFMGLVGMIDPPRPEAKAAVSICLQAGIKPVMITGDHVVTASAIASENSSTENYLLRSCLLIIAEYLYKSQGILDIFQQVSKKVTMQVSCDRKKL